MYWGFESGTTEGWANDTATGGGVVSITASTAQSHSGTSSLAVTVGLGMYSVGGSYSGASVRVPLCKISGTVNLANYTFTAWVRFSLTRGAVTQYAANHVSAWLEDSSAARNSTYGSPPNQVTVSQANLNTWMKISGPVVQPSTANDTFGIVVGMTFADYATEGYDGVMYIDDVQISP
jgi:hypothetical protein